MPSSTTNYNLTLYDKTADAGEKFLDYRDDMCGTTTDSNMNKIDTQMKANADSTAGLAGAGRTTETVKANADNIASLKTRSIYNITTSGTDTYTATSADITAYYTGLRIKISASSANTGASTVNINALGAKQLNKINATGVVSAISAGDIRVNQPAIFEYNGTTFVAISLGTAGDVLINDAGDYFTGENVETAMQQVGLSIKGATQTPTIAYGQNLITNPSPSDAFPDITFNGQHYTNLLGADGNCEDVSKWSLVTATSTLDSSKKVFGTNAIKVTLTSTGGVLYKILATWPVIEASKYYLMSAYADKGNLSGSLSLSKDTSGGGVGKSVSITDAGIMKRYAVKVQPTDINTANAFGFFAGASISGQYFYVDGIQVNEISATEYANDSVDVLMARYPYIDSYACLQNPSVEVVHDNMVRNGNGEEGIAWWNLNATPTKFAFENGYFVATDDDSVSGEGGQQTFLCKPMTSYSYRHTYKAGSANARLTIGGQDVQGVTLETLLNVNTASVADTVIAGTFTTGANTSSINVKMITGSDGTAIGTAYHKECILIPGTTPPTSYKTQRREQVVIEGKFATGDVVRLKDGKLEGTIGWEHKTLYGRDWAWAYAEDQAGHKNVSITGFTDRIGNGGFSSALRGIKPDGKVLNNAVLSSPDYCFFNTTGLAVGVADTDTGWAETIAPNADEVKAYMNGWKANANNGTRYTSWVSVVDASAPATNTIAYVSTTVAPLYKGYQLHYQLANPKAVNEYNTRLKGTMPKLENGVNVVNVDAGTVIGEVANPQWYAGDGTYKINGGSVYASLFSFLSDGIRAIFRNRAWANTEATISVGYDYRRGNDVASIVLANFDPKAQYSVDYTILRTQAPVVGTPALAYTPGVTKKIVPQFQNDPKTWTLPSAPSNDFGNDSDACIYPGGIKTKVKGVWV